MALGRKGLSYCLQIALIEIRATEQIKKAQALAAVFHNVPMRLINGEPVETIVPHMLEIAERWEVRPYIERLIDSACEKFGEETESV